MDAAREPRLRAAALTSSPRPVAVVGADEHDVRVGRAARRRDEVLDALARGDAADVEHDRRALGHDTGERVGVLRRTVARGTVAAQAHAHRVDPAGDDVVPLARRRDDHEPCASRDAARERRVERPLQRTFRRRGLNMPTGSNT